MRLQRHLNNLPGGTGEFTLLHQQLFDVPLALQRLADGIAAGQDVLILRFGSRLRLLDIAGAVLEIEIRAFRLGLPDRLFLARYGVLAFGSGSRSFALGACVPAGRFPDPRSRNNRAPASFSAGRCRGPAGSVLFPPDASGPAALTALFRPDSFSPSVRSPPPPG